MSNYKEYRSRQKTWARVLTEDVKVIVKGDDGTYSEAEMKAGDYEVRTDDGSLTYKTKAQFDGINEPVRRERQAKAMTATKVRKPKADKVLGEKATAATPANN